MVDHMRHPHAKALGVAPALLRIVAGQDRHVATAPTGLVQKTPRRGAIPDRRHDFEQDAVDRQQRVLQSILADIGIVMTHREPHDGSDVADHRFDVGRNETDLAQPQTGGHAQCPLNTAARFSTNAFAASL